MDTDGRVFRLNIQTDEVTKPPPKYAASKIGFNDFVVHGQTVSYEDRLEKIETAAAPILKAIIKSKSVAGLTNVQREHVANFLAAQSFRTEAFYEGIGSGLARKDFGPIFAELWRSAVILSAEIMRRKWVPMVIEHDDVFYLGDHPIVLQHTETPASSQPLGFDIEGVEAFMPLSPKCALYMPCASVSRVIIGGHEDALAVTCPGTFIRRRLESWVDLVRSQLLDRRKVEFSGLCHAGGLDAPVGVMRETGGLLPIAPCGRSSL